MKTLPRFLAMLILMWCLCPARALSPLGHALALDGVSQYVAVPAAAASAISNAFTVEAWVKPGAYNSWSRLIDFGNGPGLDNIICALSDGGSGQPNLTFDLPVNQSLTAPAPLPLNVWSHVAFTYDGTNGNIYINGVLAAQSPMLLQPPVTRTNDYIGRSDWSGDGYTQAVIDEFRIWKVARTPAQIQAELAAPLRGNEANLLLYYRFDSTNGVVATNSATATGSAFNGTLVNSPAWVTSDVPIVSTTADSGPGSLRQLIAVAPAGAFVTFGTNLSGQAIRLTSGQVVLSNNLTIDGSALAKSVHLNGGHTNRIFMVLSNAIVTLNSLVITNGNAEGNAGGGIYNQGTLELNECTVISNLTTAAGGGIYNQGVLTVNACTFLDNESQNHFESGGGIENAGTLTVTQSTFAGNSANGGGAIFTESGSLLTVIQSTVCSNTAFCCGGGITVYATSGTQTLLNSIVAGNSGGDIFEGARFTTTANNLTGVNPLLLPLGNYGGPAKTMPPSANSPAIDAGDDTVAGAFATDQRGLPRFFGLHVDIGAVESAYPPPAPTVVTLPALYQTATTATLNGSISARSTIATYYFQYGKTTNYSSTTPSGTVANASVFPVSAAVTGLAPATFYHGRLVASNGVATVFGSDVLFHTAGATNLVTNAKDDGSVGSLRAVVEYDAPGDTIEFAATLSGQTIRLTRGQMVLSNNVTIDGSALAKSIQINGNHTNRIFQVNQGVTVTLDALVLTNGFNSSTTVNGGAVINSGALTLINCTLAGNSANYGAGAIENTGPLTLTGCTFAGNSAGYAGAIDNHSSCTLFNCTFSGNFTTAGVSGAFFNNYEFGGTPPTVSMLNCTFSGNRTAGFGGAIYVEGGTMSVTNTIIAGNFGNDLFIRGTVTAGGANIVESILNEGTILGQDTILAVNPQLGPLGNYGGPTPTLPPLPGSPAIDNGADLATNTLATDQRGQPRLFGLRVDIGAVEAVYKPAAPTVVTLGASDRMMTTAMLNGTVTRNGGVPTAYYFQYGTTTSYGLATGTNVLAPGAVLVGAPISSLLPATFYHCRLVATNHLGRTLGSDVIFHTAVLTNVVTTIKDDGSAGSLRAVAQNAAAGDTIHFAAGLSGQTILVTNGQIYLSNNVTIDASALAQGVLLNGHAQSCIFQIMSNATVVLDSLVITNAYNFESGLSSFTGAGGGIENEGTLAMNRCLLIANGSDGEAGGIYNGGALTINDSALVNNYTYSDGFGGGGILNDGNLTINNTTLSGNSAIEGSGGGIYNDGIVIANNLTVVTNTTPAGGAGGGIANAGTLDLTNAIVAGNTASSSPDLSGSFDGSNNFIGGDPMLAPLGNYGGPTPTMPPFPGSPAIDAGADSVTGFLTTDQRGQPRLLGAHVDIGAVEANPLMLFVEVSGRGTVAPDYNGQILTNGAPYSMTATAASTYTFTNWTSGTSFPLAPFTNHAALKFVMQPNLILQANFVDLVKPTLLITNLPANGGHVIAQAFTVRGWAHDNAGVVSVYYRLTNSFSDTGWLPATSSNNYTNWLANLTLQPGTNTIAAYAVDTSGNLSATNTLKLAAVFVVAGIVAPASIQTAVKLGNGSFQLGFTGQSGAGYQIFATTNLSQNFSQWTLLGSAVESPAGSGQYQFTDSQTTNNSQCFYRVSHP